MAPESVSKTLWGAFTIFFRFSVTEVGSLFLQTTLFRAIDFYMSPRVRGTIAITIFVNGALDYPFENHRPLESRFTVYNLAVMPLLMYLEYPILCLPDGPLLAAAQLLVQNRIVPLLWSYYTRTAGSDPPSAEEAIVAAVPLVFFIFGMLCISHSVAIVSLFWCCIINPGLWLLVACGIGLAQMRKTVLAKEVASFVTAKVMPQITLKLAALVQAAFYAFLLPSKYLGQLERSYILWMGRNIESRSTYRYSKLGSGDIRLLKVPKRSNLAGLECQIVRVPLASAPPYEAISYCWGTDPPTRMIVVDGKSLKVLDSVYEALCYRRSFRQEKLLWIDSVCINQEDEPERSEQIQLMRTIFSEAVGVLAWLGDVENAMIAQIFLSSLSSKSNLFGMTTLDRLLDYRTRHDFAWRYMGVVFRQPWFTRSWMLQEIALAKRVDLVFGGVSLDWEVFAQSLPVLGNPLLGRFLGSSDAEYEVTRPLLGVKNAMIMENCRALTRGDSDVTLNEVLQFSLQFQATKGHDKVYSVLGLVNDENSEFIVPDYSKSVETVFTETMRSLLQSSRPLQSLHLAGCGTSGQYDLPSWVPDWTNSSIRPFHTSSSITYNAGTELAPKVITPPEADAQFVRIAGNVVDEILVLGQMGPLVAEELKIRETRMSYREEHLVYEWLKEAKGLVAKYVKRPYIVGQSPHHEIQHGDEVLWRTIIADKTEDKSPASAELAIGYAALETYVGLSSSTTSGELSPFKQHRLPEDEHALPRERIQDLSRSANTFLNHVAEASLGNRLAVTKSGLFAVVPPKTRVGDTLSIIWGAQTPYLMRPSATKLGSWELVGSCFVHGLMSGEGVDAVGTMFTFV